MRTYLQELDRALRDSNRRRVQESVHGPGGPSSVCSDCAQSIHEGAKHIPTAQRTYCDPCYRRRSALSLDAVFDPRPWAVIERGAA